MIHHHVYSTKLKPITEISVVRGQNVIFTTNLRPLVDFANQLKESLMALNFSYSSFPRPSLRLYPADLGIWLETSQKNLFAEIRKIYILLRPNSKHLPQADPPLPPY